MTVTTFKNMKGLIHGKDPKRIDCVPSWVQLWLPSVPLPSV